MQRQLRIIKSLADETRLKIVLTLLKGEKAATQLVPIVNKAQPTVSLNLKVLKNADVIKSRKEGKFIFYSIKDSVVIKIIKLLKLDKSTSNIQRQLKNLKSLADKTRLKIILILLKGEKAATQLVPIVGKAQPTVSLNSKVLEDADVIKSRKEGKFIFYSIKDGAVIKIIKLLKLDKGMNK